MRSMMSPIGCSLLLAAVALMPSAGRADEAAHPHLTSEFASIVKTLRSKSAQDRASFAGSGHAERAFPIVNLKGSNHDQVEAYIWLEKWDATVRSSIEALGVEITGEDRESLILQGWIPLDLVETVADVKGVRSIRRPSYGIASAGSVTTEGDAFLATTFLRTFAGVDGNGIQVGVLSNGLFNPFFPSGVTEDEIIGSNADPRVQSGDLPAYGGDPNDPAPTAGYLGNIEVFPRSLDLHVATSPYTSTGYQTVSRGDSFNFRGTTVTITGLTATTVTVQLNDPGSGTSVGAVSVGGSAPPVVFLGDYEVALDRIFEGTSASINVSYNPTGIATAPEGAAILEVVHDLAPKATLLYASGTTTVNLRAGRDFLVRRGADVIIDNMIFFDAGRFDGTSVISREAQVLAQTKDIVYLVSAGNYTAPPVNAGAGAENLGASSGRFPLYINAFFDPRGDSSANKVHNFASGRLADVRDDYLTLLPQNGVIDVALLWDDVWDDANPRATDDLDLYLNEIRGSQIGSIVASSVDVQSNSGLPYERITVTPGETRYALFIKRKNSADSSRRLFTLMVFQGTVAGEDVKYLTHGVPLNNADALPPVISVGAIDLSGGGLNVLADSIPGLTPGPGRQSSNGYLKWYLNQKTPSVVSYSGVSTLSTSQFDGDGSYAIAPFTGSSAAVAHVGGMVALLRHSRRTLPSYDYYNLLRDTNTVGRDYPNAVIVNPEVSQYVNAPTFYRPNPFDIWSNFTAGAKSETRQAVPIPAFGVANEWTSSGPIADFPQPVFGNSNGTLTISGNGQTNAAGWWQSPLFQFTDEDGNTGTALSADKVYELTARVGCDESDPTKVPNFRLRLITGNNDEAVTMDISGMTVEASNTPTTVAGKEYRLYYRPTNAAVGNQGVRFALDLANFDPLDNASATIYLNEVTLREFTPAP
ncbi:hypothetical protein GC173_00625 [bacterium]|nr:hypothetical protein [bacterium]